MSSDETNDGGLGETPGWNAPTGDTPPPPRQESPLGFAATPTEPPPSSWNTETPSAGGGQPTATPLTMSEPAPVPPPITSSGGGSSKLPWIVAVVAAVVLLGGGAFFAASIFGAAGGADSPEAAADGLLAALENEDFVTAAELLEPSERRTIAEPMLTEVLPELVRLGAVDESTEADNVEDFDLNLTETEFRVEEVPGADDLRYVFLSGGELDIDGTTEVLPTDAETPLVIVERDGQWYYSLWFTIAENARIESGEAIPLQAEAPAAIPSDSPEGAVEGMMNAVSDLDLRAMIGHMDPEEMAALYRYSPLFLDEAQQALDDVQGDLASEGFSWELSDFDFDVDQSGDDAVVSMRGFTLNVEAADFGMDLTYQRENLNGGFVFEGGSLTIDATTTEWNVDGSVDGDSIDVNIVVDPENLSVSGSAMVAGDSGQGEITFDPTGACSAYSVSTTSGGETDEESGCVEEDGGSDFVVGPIIEAFEDWPTEFPGIDMTVRQTDGGWYVSPMGTIFDGIVSGLESVEEEDFDGLFDDVADGFTSGIADDVTDGLIGNDDDIFIDDDFTEPDFDFSDPVVEDITILNYDSSEPLFVAGEISLNTFDVFEFEVEEGESTLVTVVATSDSFLDTLVTVRDVDGFEIARNDDAIADLPSSLDSQTSFVANSTGTYIVEVSAFSNGSEGEYELTIEPGEVDLSLEPEAGIIDEPLVTPPSELEPQSSVEVASGERVQLDGFVGGSQGDAIYDIALTGGDAVVITVESNDPDALDPRVTLFLDGISVGSNDDAADSSLVADLFDSRLEVTPSSDGTYLIQVDGFAGSEGDFVMTIERNFEG